MQIYKKLGKKSNGVMFFVTITPLQLYLIYIDTCIEEVVICVLFVLLILLFGDKLSSLLNNIPLDAVFVEDHIQVWCVVYLVKGG